MSRRNHRSHPLTQPFLACLCLVLTWAGVGICKGAIITVNNTADSGAGSLRAAISGAASGDTITFSLSFPARILLTSGQLAISNSVSIVGPGSNKLAIDGNFPVTTNRVLEIAPGTTVNITGVTITNGSAVGSFPAGAGGGIHNDHATLYLNNCIVTGNRAAAGGGICNDSVSGSASLLMIDSTVSGNVAVNGGGLFLDAESSGNGGATILTSTFSSNTASNLGGGIYNDATHSGTSFVQLATCTLSANISEAFAGGIYSDGSQSGSAKLFVNASTLSGNSAPQTGGGIFILAGTGTSTLDIADTILSAGTSGANLVNNGTAAVSHGYNLCSDNGGGLLNGTNDQVNTNPLLGPLQANGGPTDTHALLPGSPAIDKGNRAAIAALAVNTDQRGLPRPVGTPKAPGGDGSDIGAFEVQPTSVGTSAFLTGAQRLSNGAFQFTFTNAPGATFTVLSATSVNLPPGSWTVLGAPAETSPGQFQFTDTHAASHPQTYYRVRSP